MNSPSTRKQAARRPLEPLRFPVLERAHDVRHLVLCAYSRCRRLGDERQMITVQGGSFQSRSDGKACYHGRCYVRQFGLSTLLGLPKAMVYRLTLHDVGVDTMKAILKKFSIPRNNIKSE